MSFLTTPGTPGMDVGYTPQRPNDVVTVEFMEAVLQEVGGSGGISFITSADTLAVTNVAGQLAEFELRYVGGNPSPYIDFQGYEASGFQLQNDIGRTVITIPQPVAGDYSLEARLLQPQLFDPTGPGTLVDTLSWLWHVVSLPADATIDNVTLGDMTFGEIPAVTLAIGGTGPFRVSADGATVVPPGTNVLSTRNIPASEAITTGVFIGLPSQEGVFSNISIAVTGLSGTRVTRDYSAGIVVNRAPTWVNLSTLPPVPYNSAGVINLAQFARGYPAPTSFTATPALSTFHPDFSISGLTITFNGSMTAIAGQISSFELTLITNGIGVPGVANVQISMHTAADSPTPPSLGVLASYTVSGYSASNGAAVSVINEVAQGGALALLPVSSTRAARWDASAGAWTVRGNASQTTLVCAGLDIGPPPSHIFMRARLGGSTALGTYRQFNSLNNSQNIYFDVGTTGAAGAPTFLSATAAIFSGTSVATSTFTYTAEAAVRAYTCKLFCATSLDIVSSVTLDNGGGATPLTRLGYVKTGADGGFNLRTWLYFLGTGVPTGTLTVAVNRTLTSPQPLYVELASYTANADVEAVHTNTNSTLSGVLTVSLTLSSAGRPCIATAAIATGIGAASSVSSGANAIRVNGHNHGSGFYSFVSDRQSGSGSAAVVFSWGFPNSDSGAAVATMLSEVSAGGGIRVGFGTQQLSIGWTSAISGLVDTWNSYDFEIVSTTQANVRVGVSAGAASIYSVSSPTIIAADWQNFLVGGASPDAPDIDIRGIRVVRGSLSAGAITAQLQWCDSQSTGGLPPPPSLSSSAAFSWTLLRAQANGTTVPGAKVYSANQPFSAHASNIQITNGYSTTPNLNQALYNAPNGGEANGHLIGSTPAVRRVQLATPMGTRNFVEWTLWNTQPLWVSNGSIRIHMDTAGNQYTAYQYGDIWWMGCTFVLHPSLYFRNIGGFDWGISLIHENGSYMQPAQNQTGFTLFLEPNAALTGMQLAAQLRCNTSLNPPANENSKAATYSAAHGPILTAANNDVIGVVVEYASHPCETANISNQSAQRHYLRQWLYINGVVQNSGNPVLNATGRLGYHLQPTVVMNRRPAAAVLYAWQGPSYFDTYSANNIPGIPSGAKGARVYSGKGLHFPAGTYGGIPMNRQNVADFIHSNSD